MLGHRLRRWASISLTLVQCIGRTCRACEVTGLPRDWVSPLLCLFGVRLSAADPDGQDLPRDGLDLPRIQ